MAIRELTIQLRNPHPKQAEFINSTAKRKVIRGGRRGGKTSGVAVLAVESFLNGSRVLYATPTQEQIDRFWQEVKSALEEPVEAGIYHKNETKHIIELPRTEQRIRAKTAYNADTLRGDYADLLILDEFQDMDEDAWSLVGAPMLLDNDGNAVFVYTKKRGKNHTDDLFKKAKEDATGRWATFVFSSHDNPYLSLAALEDITLDMSPLAYQMEIMAEDLEDDPGALWNREMIHHVTSYPTLYRVGVGVDPSGSTAGNECGIIAAGIGKVGDVIHGYVLADRSLKGSPAQWGSEVVTTYNLTKADRVVGEANFGGEMVEHTIRTAEGGKNLPCRMVHASRGKAVRAEPIVGLYKNHAGLHRVHHVGYLPELESEMCNWVPGQSSWSPNRIDALVWILTDLMLGQQGWARGSA